LYMSKSVVLVKFVEIKVFVTFKILIIILLLKFILSSS